MNPDPTPVPRSEILAAIARNVAELTTPCPGWRIERHETRSGFRSYEVAISPAGVEYVRTPTRDLADLIVHTRYAGDAFWKLRSRPFTTTQEDAP